MKRNIATPPDARSVDKERRIARRPRDAEDAPRLETKDDNDRRRMPPVRDAGDLEYWLDAEQSLL